MVSITSADENKFVWKICHTVADPLTDPMNATRATCWLGMHEKPLTGNVFTPQEQQQWQWIDGPALGADAYKNWALKPGLGDGDGDGNRFFEPNNERTRRTPAGYDVRHAIMNQAEGNMSGKWYDKPAAFRAHAVCEFVPETVPA